MYKKSFLIIAFSFFLNAVFFSRIFVYADELNVDTSSVQEQEAIVDVEAKVVAETEQLELDVEAKKKAEEERVKKELEVKKKG